MKNSYIFPAVFNYASDGITIKFPDIQGCFTCADNTQEAVYTARGVLENRLYICERDGEFIPEPSDILVLKQTLQDNQIIVPVAVYMPPVRMRHNRKIKSRRKNARRHIIRKMKITA